MNLIRIDRNPSRRQLAVFGALWAVLFGILGAAALRRGATPWAAVFWTSALLVPAAGWVSPGVLRIVYLGTAYLAFPVGWVVSHALLAAVYYLVLTPIGLGMRLLGYDPMRRRFDRHAESYWIAREEADRVDRYFRQF